ncbi:MAG: murein biosynthesis integral membrane protein MurJ [bacterium]
MDQQKGGRTVASLSFINFITLFLSLFQAIVVARAFGTGSQYDLFLIAIALPEVLVYLATEVINAGLLPKITSSIKVGDKQSAYKIGFSYFNSIIAISFIFLIILEILSPWICKLIIGEQNINYERLLLIIRVILPIMVVYIAHRVVATIHNAIESFILPSISAVFPPIIISLSVLLLSSKLDIYSLVIGFFISAFIQFVFLLPLIFREGWKYITGCNINLRQGLLLIGVGVGFILGAIADRTNVLIDRAVASRLEPGRISSLKYGFQISAYLQALFSVPLNRVYYTYLSGDVASGDIDSFTNRFERGARMLAIVYIPIGVLIPFISLPLIRLLFERGAFTEVSSVLSAGALSVYAPGLFFIGLVSLTSSMMYALKKPLIFSLVGLIIIGLNLTLDIILIKYIDYLGIALTTVIVNLIWSITLIIYLSNVLSKNLLNKSLIITILRVVVASATGYFVIKYIISGMQMPDGGVFQFISIFISIILFMTFTWGLAFILGEKLLKDVFKLRF